MSPARRAALGRWAAAALVVGLLGLLPALAGVLPAGAAAASPQRLLAGVRASATVAYSGYAESAGSFALPAVSRLGDVADLFSGTTRMRVWSAGRNASRVDEITPIGETGTYRAGGDVQIWDSGDRRVTRLLGPAPVRLPQPADLLPPELGRRLAAAARASELRALPPRRVAGHAARGLRIVPATRATTVRWIDLWVEPASGLPLEVEVTGRGASRPSLRTRFLDLRLDPPAAARTRFRPPPDATVISTGTPDLAAVLDRFSPYRLPGRLAGLQRRARVSGIGATGGTATYGTGYTLLTLLPLPEQAARSTLAALTAPPAVAVRLPGAEAAGVDTPLVKALVVVAKDRGYALAGSVPLATLRAAAAALVRRPPGSRFGP